MLIASALPFAVIFYWLSSETVYRTPDRPSITYITTFDPDRTDAEITASNIENQEVKDLREQAEEDLAQRKRDLYKALGAAAGMDVEEIEARADAERAAAEAEAQAERDAMFGRSADAGEAADDGTAEEGSAP
ncbi:MAG: hypothetical protein AAGE86_09040 [Pseudomonadota bacterium]